MYIPTVWGIKKILETGMRQLSVKSKARYCELAMVGCSAFMSNYLEVIGETEAARVERFMQAEGQEQDDDRLYISETHPEFATMLTIAADLLMMIEHFKLFRFWGCGSVDEYEQKLDDPAYLDSKYDKLKAFIEADIERDKKIKNIRNN